MTQENRSNPKDTLEWQRYVEERHEAIEKGLAQLKQTIEDARIRRDDAFLDHEKRLTVLETEMRLKTGLISAVVSVVASMVITVMARMVWH